jgi:hypothetical protein
MTPTLIGVPVGAAAAAGAVVAAAAGAVVGLAAAAGAVVAAAAGAVVGLAAAAGAVVAAAAGGADVGGAAAGVAAGLEHAASIHASDPTNNTIWLRERPLVIMVSPRFTELREIHRDTSSWQRSVG